MDRYWLLTWTTYGTWLPGDRRGFVSNVRDESGKGTRHNLPGDPCDTDMPALQQFMENALAGPPVFLEPQHAQTLLKQFQETARHRRWTLLAVAIMPNHVHLVVGVEGDPEPSRLLGDFKSYGSRALNQAFGKLTGGTWWTESGSKRKLSDAAAVMAAIRYVKDQYNPLLVWITDNIIGERGA